MGITTEGPRPSHQKQCLTITNPCRRLIIGFISRNQCIIGPPLSIFIAVTYLGILHIRCCRSVPELSCNSSSRAVWLLAYLREMLHPSVPIWVQEWVVWYITPHKSLLLSRNITRHNYIWQSDSSLHTKPLLLSRNVTRGTTAFRISWSGVELLNLAFLVTVDMHSWSNVLVQLSVSVSCGMLVGKGLVTFLHFRVSMTI